MREVSQDEQNKIMDILRRNQEEIKSFEGVHYVDVGYKFVDGHPSEELAIRVHVPEKKPESALESTEVLPQQIEGIPVDVIQSEPQLHQNPRDQRFDPLLGGIAIRNVRHNFFGTLGMIVRASSSP